MTVCGACGDCCENMALSTTKKHFVELLEFGDVRGDEVWAAMEAYWVELCEPGKGNREAWARNQADARFIIKHWHGGKRDRRQQGEETTSNWSCDRFDPVTRLCTAHDDRPPICRGYPYYDREPGTGRLIGHPRCSFWADFPEEVRPEGWAPVAFLGAVVSGGR